MEQKVWFKNSKGNRLCGILSNPVENKNRPIIILCHGRSSSKNSKTCKLLEKMLNENQISIFRFDIYGHGESEGKFEDVTVSEAVDDVLNAVGFLKKQGYSKIGLFGSSFGGLASIIACSKSKYIFLLSLKSPVSSYKELYVKRLGLKSSFLEDAKKNNGYLAAKKIRIPVLIVHGDADKDVPIGQSRKTAKIINNSRLEILKGADHSFTSPGHFEKMIKLISGFIIENCK